VNKPKKQTFRCSEQRPYSEEALRDFVGDQHGLIEVEVFHPLREIPNTNGAMRCPYCGVIKPAEKGRK
jgi:hypothetical protein